MNQGGGGWEAWVRFIIASLSWISSMCRPHRLRFYQRLVNTFIESMGYIHNSVIVLRSFVFLED